MRLRTVKLVGDAYTPSGADHAYLDNNGTMTDLNSLIDPHLGWTLETATAINDNGQIVGWGTNASGQTEAFLLSNPVPEPSSLVLAALGFTGLAAWGWRWFGACVASTVFTFERLVEGVSKRR
jgi:probable HAF family extracellular repeat protein